MQCGADKLLVVAGHRAQFWRNLWAPHPYPHSPQQSPKGKIVYKSGEQAKAEDGKSSATQAISVEHAMGPMRPRSMSPARSSPSIEVSFQNAQSAWKMLLMGGIRPQKLFKPIEVREP